jgi:hypothetical protein
MCNTRTQDVYVGGCIHVHHMSSVLCIILRGGNGTKRQYLILLHVVYL